jgi:hypothetical protein
MTNDQFPMTNGGRARTARHQGTSREFNPPLVIGHWDLVIAKIIRERVRG